MRKRFANHVRVPFLLGMGLLALPRLACAADLLGCPGSQWPWQGQGPFVNVPAAFAASPSGLVSAGLAIAFAPADLIEAAVTNKPQEDAIPRFAHVGICAGVYLGKGIGWIVGSPFWLLKQVFWTGPKCLFSGSPPPEIPPGQQ